MFVTELGNLASVSFIPGGGDQNSKLIKNFHSFLLNPSICLDIAKESKMIGCQISLVTVLFSTGFLANSPQLELRWNNDYRNAKQAAQSSERPMVVVLENLENTGQQLDTDKLGDVNRDRLRSKQFELCRVNVNTAYGKLVAEAFGAKQFPYTAVTDEKSKWIVFRKAGPMSQLDWSDALAMSAPKLTVVDTQVHRHDRVIEFGASPVTITPSSGTCFT